jgi:hypothetical protein
VGCVGRLDCVGCVGRLDWVGFVGRLEQVVNIPMSRKNRNISPLHLSQEHKFCTVAVLFAFNNTVEQRSGCSCELLTQHVINMFNCLQVAIVGVTLND